MQLITLFGLLFAALPTAVNGVSVPNSDTPLFNLVATGCACDLNFNPARLYGDDTPYMVLNGTGPIAEFYYSQGNLVTVDPNTGDDGQPLRVFINTQQAGVGECATSGQLGAVLGSSTNKCASYRTFGLMSFEENAQLGARPTFNYIGGFHVCGEDAEIYYKVDPDDAPSDCTPVYLYTVPVEYPTAPV